MIVVESRGVYLLFGHSLFIVEQLIIKQSSGSFYTRVHIGR